MIVTTTPQRTITFTQPFAFTGEVVEEIMNCYIVKFQDIEMIINKEHIVMEENV